MAAAARRVTVEYAPRRQFLAFHHRAARFTCIVAHRRCGKTVACINELLRAAGECKRPDGRYAYIAPLFNQAKDVAWSYLKHYARPMLRDAPNESELRVDVLSGHKSGARIRIYGADNPDRLRGIYLDGVVLDEYADMDPTIWGGVIRPLLTDRQGWATFIGTPKGRNDFATMFDRAATDPDWCRYMLKASDTGLLPAAELESARRDMSEDQYEQEFECSFMAAVVGSYYGREIAWLEAEKRIGRVPWEPTLPVHTAWDLGIGDSTVIWFAQFAGKEVRLIDCLEHSGVGLAWYANELRSRPYTYGDHILPHDAEVKELGSGQSRIETLRSLGVFNTRVIAAQRIEDGIQAVRNLLPRCWIDAEKCAKGLAALKAYRREFDEKRKIFHDRPLHDWSSHAADGLRYLALGQPKDRAAVKLVYSNKGIL